MQFLLNVAISECNAVSTNSSDATQLKEMASLIEQLASATVARKKWRKWESSRDRGFVLLLGMQCIIINYIYYIINKYNCFSTCGDQSLLSRHRRHWCIQQAKALHSIDNVEIISIEEE